MQHFKIRRGERPPADPVPTGPVEDVTGVASVAILGEDWPGLRPHMEVKLGALVSQGDVLFTDRTHREIRHVAPVSGIVESLTYGPRRSLDSLVLRVVPGAGVSKPLGARLLDQPRETLLASGFWPAFRTRPFGCTPAPDAIPDAILVNAVQAARQAPDPAQVLEGRLDAFRQGCEVLARLANGPVHVCQSPGAPLGPDHETVRHASFSGTRAAGLAGTQIDRLCRGLNVWSIGCQDVAAIGQGVATGTYDGQRVVAVTGPAAPTARLLRVPLGARIADLIGPGPVRSFSSGPGAEREAAFLGRFDTQITLRPTVQGVPARRFRAFGRRPSAMIPTRALERAVAVDVLPVPLLRALSLGDTEAARRLGCLALVEEDVAAATRTCTSGVDYGACLRGVLNDLMAEAT